MARSISGALQAQLDKGMIARTEMILFDFPNPTGQVGFFSGVGEFVWSGITFVGAGTLFDVSVVGASSSGAAVGLAIRLNGDAREGLTPTVLASIETIQYRGRPVSIYRRYMDPVTYAEIATEALYRGYIDTIDHNLTENGEVYLEASVESRALDLGRSGYRMRTDADQRLIDPSDGLFKDVGTVQKKEISWGSFTPYIPAPVKKKKWYQF
jgi:hypothetical protein